MLYVNVNAMKSGIYKGLLDRLNNVDIDSNLKYIPEEDKLFYKDVELDTLNEVAEDLKSYDIAILHGFGSGKTIRNLRNKFKRTFIIVFETNFSLLKLLLSEKDLSDILTDKNTLIVPLSYNYKDEIDKLLGSLTMKLLWADVYQYSIAGYEKVDFYNLDEIKEYTRRFLAAFYINRSTLLHKSEIITENSIKNTLSFLRGGPLRLFVKNKFENKPAIIVASGPSLMKNIDKLKGLKDKALVIAADSVLGTLNEFGIKPDIVCGVDYNPINIEKYKTILKDKKKSDFIYIHTAAVYHQIPKIFKKSVVECHSLSLSDLYGEIFGDFNDVSLPSNAVTHTAIAVAYYLRANPIIFVGQDWAFTGGLDHAKGVSVEVDLPKQLHWVRGNYQDKVPTDHAMYTGLKLVEDIIKVLSPKGFKFINATEGGAYIEGAELLTLEDVQKKYLKDNVDKTVFEINNSSDYDKIISKTEQILGGIEQIIRKSKDALKMAKDVLDKWKINKDENQIRKRVNKINAINDEITFDEIFISAVQNFFFKDFFYFNREEIDIEGQSVEDRINQAIKYFKLIREKSILSRKHIKNLLDILKLEYEFKKDADRFLKKKEKVVNLLKLYVEFKDIYTGIELVDRAIEIYKDSADLYYWKGKLCSLNRFMHKETLESFQKAIEINPDHKKAKFDYKVEQNMVASHLLLAKRALDNKDFIDAKRLVLRALDYEPENEEAKKWFDVVEEMSKVSKDIKRQNLLYAQLSLEGDIFDEYKKAIDFVKKEQLDKAFDILVELYDKYGSFGDIPFLLGSIYIDRKELDKAEKYLKEAVELIPYQPLVYLALGKLYLMKENYYAAKENLEKAINMNPDLKPGILDTLGNLYYEFGEYEKAFRAFEEFLQYSDDKIKTLTKIALCYKEMGMINKYNTLMDKIKPISSSN
ncbi:6-hydroxymethylpterin diphosphokinase MptE-like protein [Hippea maritima]|uniref:6-hydroxymethylpterin diphosphokinase MptE-like domain-containing protein n=1 Tax=Hippea maritima (strain ATCC 700847 / DSM 10411 / MH2) TaxID=760142 RepID=F2LUJ7_HIPMA|nr:6-hydroxymethylpterin diphosphokinase MptE-like protein [Hippea maritima]AEA34587.1 protein of unknown function DUF115 [Hippea maritima DSM 10411]